MNTGGLAFGLAVGTSYLAGCIVGNKGRSRAARIAWFIIASLAVAAAGMVLGAKGAA